MRANCIIRRVDDLGRVVIPKEIRHIMNIADGDPMEIYIDDSSQAVVMRKYMPEEAVRSTIESLKRNIGGDEMLRPEVQNALMHLMSSALALLGGEANG